MEITAGPSMNFFVAALMRYQEVLVTLLKELSLNYCGKTTFQDGGEALAHILKENNDYKMLPSLNKTNKDLFYHDVSTNTFILRENIDLLKMDITLIFDIITRILCFPTCLKQLTNNCPPPSQQVASKEICCGKCQHICKSCKKGNCDCQNASWDHKCENCSATISSCLKLVCTTCEGKPLNEQCGFDRFMRALDFHRKFYQFYCHCTLETYRKFIVGQYIWKDYPNIRNWLTLAEKLIEYYNYLLNFMCNGNAFKQPLLLHLKKEKLLSMKKLMEDMIDKSARFYRRKEIYRESPLHLEMLCDQEYSFSLTVSIHDILKVEIVTEQNTLKEIPDEKFSFLSFENLTIIRFKDLNFVEENRFFKVRLEYEILVDCNDVIWVSSSNRIERDVYKTSMIGYQDDGGKNIFVSSHGNLVQKKEIVAEKLNLGVCALFPKEGIDKILVVQLKNSADMQWNCHSYESLREAKEYFILSLSGLEWKQKYDIRILCTKKSDELQRFVLLQVFNEEVLGDFDLMHVTYHPKNKFVVFSHSYENQSSPHKVIDTVNFKNLQKAKQFHLFVQRCSQYTLRELLHYLPTHFGKENVITFPPIYNTFITLLQNSFLQMKKEFCVILPNFNFSKAMDFMGLDCTQFGLNSKTFDNGFLVFDLDLHLILSLRICNGNTINDIRTSMELTHADTKALILLCKDFIGKDHLTVYGTIAFPNFSSRAELDDSLFCEFCRSELNFLTAEDMQDEEHLSQWWQEMLDDIRADDYQNEDILSTNYQWFSKIANQLMVPLAREREIFSAIDGKRIENLLLNPDQLKAIYHPSKKKFITGPFGSGKSIVSRNILKESIMRSCDIGTIFYVNMDPYSLSQVEMENYCKIIKKDLPKNLNLESVNIREISIESGLKSFSSLLECLQYLSLKNVEETETTYLFDEYDSEYLNSCDAKLLKWIPKSSYRNATVVVVAQSKEKGRSTREIDLLKEIDLLHSDHSFKEAGMELFILNKTMRFSKFLDTATEILDQFARLQNPLTSHLHKKDVKKKEINIFYDFSMYTDQLQVFSYSVIKTLRRNFEIDLVPDDKTHFRHILEICFCEENKGGLVICNSLEHLDWTKKALREIPLNFIEYAEYIQLKPPPSIQRKREVYDICIKNPNFVLVTDMRSCRGIKYEKVIFIIDEEHHERHLFVEALCRCTSQLFILSFVSRDSEGISLRDY